MKMMNWAVMTLKSTLNPVEEGDNSWWDYNSYQDNRQDFAIVETRITVHHHGVGEEGEYTRNFVM